MTTKEWAAEIKLMFAEADPSFADVEKLVERIQEDAKDDKDE